MPDHYLKHEDIDELKVISLEPWQEIGADWLRAGWVEVEPPPAPADDAEVEIDGALEPASTDKTAAAAPAAGLTPEQASAPLDTPKEK